ncbi:FAS1-like dehydratase domain-containing protein [Glaciibacter superstes]|uniref:FAS1-like dehydratase domain-containing protein n=1 Tax=Glaciibacter superstes TaxID=501023 RepID=UPI00146F33C6|nr:MaoC family dehydratase N-terminal domain-containing protein [Glaciibacter superstes]
MPDIKTVDVGFRFPDHGPIAVQLEDMVRWAAASGDYTAFHFDQDEAEARGFPAPVVHGPWKAAVLRSLVESWLGAVNIPEFSVRYLAPDFVGDAMVFGGEVAAIEASRHGRRIVRCDLWATRSDGVKTVTATCVATTDDGAEAATDLPLQRVMDSVRLGEPAGTFVYRIDGNDVDRFVDAIGGQRRTGPEADIAPATFYAALDPVERRDLDLDGFVQNLPFPKIGGGNAFNEVEYQRPLRKGDVITVTTRYTEVYEKEGSTGTLLFRVRENELRDADGELVATTRCGHVLAFDMAIARGVTS